MTIKLFTHNKQAYEAALVLMEDCGKAAVIHPTGTGKSFIGFTFALEHPKQQISWLSPSETIYHTQIENLQAAGGNAPENVVFLTYAKLMGMDEDDMKELCPDTIILDEFHRCGATEWGKGVSRLLRTYPDTPILGLSATNIRYLDNQRDMADELFDNHIASEMTLGEAIARGILAAPKYITSVYRYQKELTQYEKRIAKAKSAAVRDKAQVLLDALRRALEKADGLDIIFKRHMSDKTGKYLVFCSSADHMDEMMGHAQEWFGGIDPGLHCYKAYSQDPETDAAFTAFKADDSAHLKLLFCIDMLNEGIHVEGVSGVILFRPTISPIIYKQQIGRALSATSTTTPIIFDIVNNFENLYSIQAIEEEMQEALIRYHAWGEEGQHVENHFTIIDEVQDCRQLFETLTETLSASWETMYQCARDYYNENGHLDIPVRTTTPEGYALGNWIATQRSVRAGNRYGSLSEDRINRLDAIGMVWDKALNSWKQYYQACAEYYGEHGNLDVPQNYTTPEGLRLDAWIRRIRAIRDGRLPQYTPLTEDQIARLNAIHFIWEDAYTRRWQYGYEQAKAYYEAHGHLDIPTSYTTNTGFNLGKWLNRHRPDKKTGKPAITLTPERKAALTALGFQWESEDPFEKRIALCQEYYKAHGDLNPPADYKAEGIWLSRWIADQRRIYRGQTAGKSLRPEQIAKLESVGMDWRTASERAWEEQYQAVQQYVKQHGDAQIPGNTETREAKRMRLWLSRQKKAATQGKLNPVQQKRLSAIGILK